MNVNILISCHRLIKVYLTGAGDCCHSTLVHTGTGDSVGISLYYLYKIQNTNDKQMIYFITYLLFFSK